MNAGGTGSARAARTLVRLASGIVPGGGRREWRAEWDGELCHVCGTRSGDPVRFALGAFQDAFWIRSDHLISRARCIVPRGSPVRCLAELLLLAAAGLALCAAVPGTRRASSAALCHTPANLVVISSDGYAGTQSPSISLSHYRQWKADASRMFVQIAYYRPGMRRMLLQNHRPVNLAVAVASDNLLQVLALSDSTPSTSGRRLFLSRSVWRSQFHADPSVIGRTAFVDGNPVLIAAVLPDGDWHLPGGVQAVQTENPQQLDSLPSGADGFVVARLRSSAFPAQSGGWHFLFEERNDTVRQFECIPFSSIFKQPMDVFLLALLAACLTLPATTPLRLGDYPERSGRLQLRMAWRRWTFFATKLIAVVLIAGLWSFALAYGGAAVGSSASLYIQMGTAFPALLCGFRWAMHDQRRRCPVCLRLLSNPARVGQPSWNFLAWCGTEWMCRSGHGLLHIPELPTCWFSTQRWLCLDSSWAGLFPAGPAAP